MYDVIEDGFDSCIIEDSTGDYTYTEALKKLRSIYVKLSDQLLEFNIYITNLTPKQVHEETV